MKGSKMKMDYAVILLVLGGCIGASILIHASIPC